MVYINKYVPRVLAIAYIVFISLFALDSTGLGFLIHMIPSFLFIGATVYAWKKPRNGGILFVILGLITIFMFDTIENIFSFLLVTLPLLVIGLMFYKLKQK